MIVQKSISKEWIAGTNIDKEYYKLMFVSALDKRQALLAKSVGIKSVEHNRHIEAKVLKMRIEKLRLTVKFQNIIAIPIIICIFVPFFCK